MASPLKSTQTLTPSSLQTRTQGTRSGISEKAGIAGKAGIAEETLMKIVFFVIIVAVLVFIIVTILGPKLKATTAGIPWT